MFISGWCLNEHKKICLLHILEFIKLPTSNDSIF